MRVAVDARPFLRRPTGVGRYLDGLLAAWLRAYPADELLLLSPRPVSVPPALAGRVERVGRESRLPGTVWLHTVAAPLARRAGADLFLGSLSVLPLLPALPGVAVIHDLTPWLFPEWHSGPNRLGFNPFAGATVRLARRIATVSEATRRDLVAAFPEAAGKAVVVHNGVTPVSAGDDETRSDARRPPYVLYLGTLEPRKNILRLVEAMESLWDEKVGFPDLLLAGGEGWGLPGLDDRLRRSRHASRIQRLGYVDAGEARQLLRGARVLAYPSLYEGFGLPPLEAMSLGTVVVGSSSSSLPEVIGDAGLLPDPTSVPAIAAALARAVDDEGFRAEARARGLERSLTFTWEAAARKMRALCEAAAGTAASSLSESRGDSLAVALS